MYKIEYSNFKDKGVKEGVKTPPTPIPPPPPGATPARKPGANRVNFVFLPHGQFFTRDCNAISSEIIVFPSSEKNATWHTVRWQYLLIEHRIFQ